LQETAVCSPTEASRKTPIVAPPSYVDRTLRGAKPGDLPVQFPTKFEMVVNRKAATALGLAIPPSILLRADEQIE
jgi:putative ABC transport system substrate-binding protein